MIGATRHAAMACLLAIVAVMPTAAQAPKFPAIKGFERFQEWARLVPQHVPGQLDSPSREIAAWPADDLQRELDDLSAVVKLLVLQKNPKGKPPNVVTYQMMLHPAAPGQAPLMRPRSIKLEQIPALLQIPKEDFNDARVTRLMKQAAMLHADIALLGAASGGPVPDLPPVPSTPIVVRLVDGDLVSRKYLTVHWAIGRAALDGVAPVPSADAMVQLWYRATAAFQEYERSYSDAAPHLEHARLVLPDDPLIFLYSGMVNENLAAPTVQVAVDAFASPERARFSVKSVGEELQRAEGFLRRAVELSPDLAVAHVRLGRVLGRLGRHEEAASRFKNALVLGPDSVLEYYAQLFLGGEERQLGHLAEARTAFERAIALFPLAQSPLLALGQLAWQADDRSGALGAMNALARLSGGEFDRPDPWWVYDVFPVDDAPSLIAKLRAAAAKEWGR